MRSNEPCLAILGAHGAADVRLQALIDFHVALVLDAADGNLSLAAELLGVNRRAARSA